MKTASRKMKAFIHKLDKTNNGMLIVTPKREIICYSEKFRDTWELSKKSLNSRNEMAGLKEAMQKVDGPQQFNARVTEMYAKGQPDSNTVRFKNGLSIGMQLSFFSNDNKKLIAWTITLIQHDLNKIKMLPALTRGEQQVLYHYLFGFTAKAIANRLSISFRTVEDHIESIKEKFGCSHRDDFIKIAKSYGLIKVESPDFIKFLN